MCCEYIRPLFSDPKREEFYMIAMNDDYVPLKEIYIASGIPNRVQFDTHKLLRDAVASQCTCVVLAHNHPSGLAALPMRICLPRRPLFWHWARLALMCWIM